jgi:putative transcriptional regulator
MGRTATGVLACALLWATAAPPLDGRASALKAGLFLYAAPGLPDPNFSKAVVLLIEHGAKGSVGVIVNQPTSRRLEDVLDLREGALAIDVPVFRGGPVQPEAILALVRTPRPGLGTRAVVKGVYVTNSLDDVRAVLAEPGGRLRARVFSGYAGWGRGQLADELREGSWVLDQADAATVFSPEPSRVWEKVHEIRTRLVARAND